MLIFTFKSHPKESPHHGVIYLALIELEDVHGKWEITGAQWENINQEAHKIISKLAWDTSDKREKFFHLETVEDDRIVKTIDVCVVLQ